MPLSWSCLKKREPTAGRNNDRTGIVVKTYNDIYIAARKKLRAEGVEAYGLEARLIVAGAAAKTKEQFMRDLNLYVAGDFEERVDGMIRRRLSGEPVAYITGEWEFYGLSMSVNQDVLIPRIDTEVLADKAIEVLKTRNGESVRLLDLCCGSGCVGIAVTYNVPGCKTILSDHSLRALMVSRQNVLKHNLTRRVTCIEADALKAPPMLIGKFDMVVCNPPYIPTGDLKKLDPSVRNYEPVLALDGGKDGLDFYRSILTKWRAVLKNRGCLMLECGAGQCEYVSAMMKKAGFVGIETYEDTLGIKRVAAGVLIKDE